MPLHWIFLLYSSPSLRVTSFFYNPRTTWSLSNQMILLIIPWLSCFRLVTSWLYLLATALFFLLSWMTLTWVFLWSSPLVRPHLLQFFFLIPVDFLNSFHIPVDQCFLSNSSYHNLNFGITSYEMTTTFTHTADFVLSPPNFEIPKDRTQEIEKVYEILSFLKITFGRSIQHFNAYGWVIFVFDTRCMWAQICGQ